MKKIAVFPGSFDPITRGHESVVLRSIGLFDEMIIAVGNNTDKKCLFAADQRMEWIRDVFRNEPRISVSSYSGLTVDFCRSVNAGYILRGLRTSADFEFERSVGQMNKVMLPGIETVFILALPEHTALSSSVVRDIFIHGGDITPFIPLELNIQKCRG